MRGNQPLPPEEKCPLQDAYCLVMRKAGTLNGVMEITGKYPHYQLRAGSIKPGVKVFFAKNLLEAEKLHGNLTPDGETPLGTLEVMMALDFMAETGLSCFDPTMKLTK